MDGESAGFTDSAICKAGRAIGRPKTTSAKEAEIRAMLAASNGIRKTTAVLGVGVSVVQRVAREAPAMYALS